MFNIFAVVLKKGKGRLNAGVTNSLLCVKPNAGGKRWL